MKKSMLFIMLLALVFGAVSNLSAQVTVTIGNGRSTNTRNETPTPYGTDRRNFRQQYLFLASEIEYVGGSSGNINSLTFKVQNTNSCIAMPNFRIRLKHTGQTALTTDFETGAYQEVFVQNNFLPDRGWNTHTFSTPFFWNGENNILVDIVTDYCAADLYADNASVYYTPTTFYTSLNYQSDTSPAIIATTGIRSMNRANIRFNMAELTPTNSPNPAIGVYPPNGASFIEPLTSLVWTHGGGVPAGFKLNFGTNNPPNNIVNNLDLGAAVEYTPTTELDFDTTYYWQITPYNAFGNAQNCPIWSFTTSGSMSVTIGSGISPGQVPFNFSQRNSLFQGLYFQHEIGMFGNITALSFYNNFSTDIPDTPIKLWLGTTTQADLSAGWIDPNALTLVFDGTMDFPPEQNTITFSFIEPFCYYSGNLVLYANRPMDTGGYGHDRVFLAQSEGGNRALALAGNEYIYNPMIPPAEGDISGAFPKITLYMNMDAIGSLSGNVTASANVLANVRISIEDTNFHTTTSASGQYSFPYLQAGDYTLTAYKLGYEEQSINLSIVENEHTTVDIVMIESVPVNITGVIVGSDNPMAGLDNVAINFYGAMNYNVLTNAFGQFVMENVLSGNAFDYTINKVGYQTETGTIILTSGNYDMGTITLNELAFPPTAIAATVNDAGNEVNLVWGSPGTAGNSYFFDFELDDGGWVPSSNWANPLGDWEYTDNYDVINWDPILYGPSIMPPNTAHSGIGMWGTVIYSNHHDSGGCNYLTQTFDFSGFDNTQLKFWSWENLWGASDYAQVKVNGTLVWGPSWDSEGTIWRERIIDLSAYDGMSNVEVRFEMQSSTFLNYAGWYIDDVYIGPADQMVNIFPPSAISGKFRRLSEQQTTELAEEKTNQYSITNSIRQPIHNPSRSLLGYEVWRLKRGEENTPSLWVLLTPVTITDTTFTDPAWASLPDGFYRWAVRTIYNNDVVSDHGFSNAVRRNPNDMSALSIIGNTTPTVGITSTYTIRVRNTGTTAQVAGAYDVKLMSGTTELASSPGPAIAASEITNVEVNWDPAAPGSIQIYGKVALQDDSNSANDETDPIDLIVMPAGQLAYTVGEGNQLAAVPVNMFSKTSLFQMIIYPVELGNFSGFINGIQFYNNFVTDLAGIHTKIWFENTTLQNFGGGWIGITDGSSLVFDGNVDYPSGENTITIPFHEPFYQNGGNLLITVLRPMDTLAYSIHDRFRAQTIGVNRAYRGSSDTIIINPTQPTFGIPSGQFPMTTFLGISSAAGHLSGTVTTGGDNDPLEGVLVQLEAANQGAGYETTTNADGEYTLSNVLPDTYDMQFSRYGYLSQTQTFGLAEDEEAVINVNMQTMPTVSVSGTVVTSDAGTGLSGAVIELFGYADYIESANADGEFTFPAVYASKSYEYIITCPGYTSITGSVNVSTTAYQMGNIALVEIPFAPSNVVAEENNLFTAALLQWEAPNPNPIEILESFENNIFPPQHWSQIITNAGPQNAFGVYPTFKRLGAIEIDNETDAMPTHGGFQTGLWWSFDHQDEWLITPAFNCPSNAYMRYDSYVFRGSVHSDHYYVKVSTDGGNTWQILWDASAETGGQTAYEVPFVVDLAPYGGQQITLAFHAKDPPANDGLRYSWFIDNIYIGNNPTIANLDGPALVHRHPVSNSNMPASGAPIRDDRVLGAKNVKPAAKFTGRDSRVLIGYQIYRLTPGQEASETSWTLLSDEPINTLDYEDHDWQTLPNGAYRWGVKAIYSADVNSQTSFSNLLTKTAATGSIVGFVRRKDGQGIPEATVTAGTHETTTNHAGTYSLMLPVGIYSVSASAENYGTVTIDDIVVSPNQNTTLNIMLDPTTGEDELSPVTATTLKGNSPNPFNPSTTIYYDILEPCIVRLNIYNVKGQKVRGLLNEARNGGRHSIVFEARDENGKALSSGIYFYRLTAGKYNATRKMLLME